MWDSIGLGVGVGILTIVLLPFYAYVLGKAGAAGFLQAIKQLLKKPAKGKNRNG